VEDDQQEGRGHRVVEQDVAVPDEHAMQETEQGQRERAAHVGREERSSGGLRTAEHHRETHAEQQREHRPELAADENVHEPAGPVVDAGDPGGRPTSSSLIGRLKNSTFIRRMPNNATTTDDIERG
jgi:hypothetical protein